MGANGGNEHQGHRQRMKKRFINHGFRTFEQHEILEMYLYYAIPRKDTNPLAHRLLERYGSIGKVCDAPIDILMNDFGLSESAAVLLKMLPELSSVYVQSKLDAEYIDMLEAAEIIRPLFIGATSEKIALALSDSKDKLILCDIVSVGSLNSTDLPVRKIVDLAIRHNAKYAYIAHNHPSGLCIPSRSDIEATKLISNTLRSVGVMLVDHIIFTETETFSVRSNKNYEKLAF